MMRLLAVLLALLLAAPAAAQTPEERARLDWAVTRGRLLFEVDRAAWVTTDDMQARLAQADQQLVRGWTVERDGAGYAVTYFMTGENNIRRALYRGRVENRRVVSRETFRPGAGPELTPMQRRIAEAYGLIGQMNGRICGPRPNLAVIPPDSPEAPMDVYVLTPQTQTGIFPFGGHNRATFSAAGALLSQRAFTNTCLNLSDRPPEGGSQVAGLVVTHLLDPIPTEIHVFMSIWMNMPVFVSTGEPHRVWEVTGARISLVDARAAAPTT
jgi:hypothetical protein